MLRLAAAGEHTTRSTGLEMPVKRDGKKNAASAFFGGWGVASETACQKAAGGGAGVGRGGVHTPRGAQEAKGSGGRSLGWMNNKNAQSPLRFNPGKSSPGREFAVKCGLQGMGMGMGRGAREEEGRKRGGGGGGSAGEGQRHRENLDEDFFISPYPALIHSAEVDLSLRLKKIFFCFYSFNGLFSSKKAASADCRENKRIRSRCAPRSAAAPRPSLQRLTSSPLPPGTALSGPRRDSCAKGKKKMRIWAPARRGCARGSDTAEAGGGDLHLPLPTTPRFTRASAAPGFHARRRGAPARLPLPALRCGSCTWRGRGLGHGARASPAFWYPSMRAGLPQKRAGDATLRGARGAVQPYWSLRLLPRPQCLCRLACGGGERSWGAPSLPSPLLSR